MLPITNTCENEARHSLYLAVRGKEIFTAIPKGKYSGGTWCSAGRTTQMSQKVTSNSFYKQRWAGGLGTFQRDVRGRVPAGTNSSLVRGRARASPSAPTTRFLQAAPARWLFASPLLQPALGASLKDVFLKIHRTFPHKTILSGADTSTVPTSHIPSTDATVTKRSVKIRGVHLRGISLLSQPGFL